MKKKLLVLFCFIFFNLIYSQTNWELLNPKPTANTGKDIKFVSSNVGYIITSSELLETTDAGVSWQKKQTISSGNDMAFHNGHGYIVGDYGYVLKSTDNGVSWEEISTGFNTNSFTSVTIIDLDNILFSSTNSIVKTSDGGVTWQSLSIPNVSVNRTVFVTSQIGHAACDNGTILKTIDGGQNWYSTQSYNFHPSDYITMHFVNENVGFATREHSTTYKTINGGETWVELTGISNAVYDFHFLDENIGFSTGDTGDTFKTTDGGLTWSNIFFQNGSYGNTTMYGIYFQDSNIGFATGARGRIVKTIDGGATWTEHSPTYNDIEQLQFVNTTTAYARARNIFYKTTDSGDNWTAVGSFSLGTSVAAGPFIFTDENLGYASTSGPYGGHVFKTTNGGVTWTILNNGYDIIDEGIASIFFLDANTGFISGGYNQRKVMKTINGGTTWSQVASIAFGQMQFLNAQVGYGYVGNKIYKTADGGQTWNIPIEVNGYINSIHFLDENTGYFVGDNALMYKTSDGGTTWRKLNSQYGFYDIVKFYSNNVGYTVSDSGMLYKTMNGGESWQHITSQYGMSSIDFFGDVIFTAGVNGRIYRSGVTFDPFVLQVNSPLDISNTSVTLNGSAASNAGTITNLHFEYSTDYFFNTIVIPTNPNLVTEDQSLYFSSELTNLSPNTTYFVRLSGEYNSNPISSLPLSFNTLPSYEIVTDYTLNFTSTTASIGGSIISAEHDITDVAFEYGTSINALSENVSGSPLMVSGNSMEYITSILNNLEPETQYFYRIKAVHQGEVIYGQIQSFITRVAYSIFLNHPYISGSNADIGGYVVSNGQEITDLAIEFGTINYENTLPFTPSQIVANGSASVSVTLTDLDANTVYYYRLRGIQNGNVIYSDEYVLNISETIIMVSGTINETETNSLELRGLINSYGTFLSNVHFEYGTTESFGSTVAGNPNYVYGMNTHSIKGIITVVPNQTYYYRLVGNYDGNTIYSNTYQFTTGILGIGDILSEKQLFIYPNPASHFVNIQVKNPESIDSIAVYDIQGKLIYLENNTNSSNLIRIDISRFAKGLYLLNVNFKDSKSVSKKLLLN